MAYLVSQKPVLDKEGQLLKWETMQRFVLPQDTGAAIKGAGRADLFWGNGHYAETAAGNMKEQGQLYFLVKKNARKDTPQWQHSSQVFHERAEEYDSWFENSLLFAIEKAAIQSLNIAFSRPALEIGVGPGRFAEALQIPFGIDPAFAPLVLAQKRGISTCQAIAEELPFASSSLGAIFLLFTLCFLESPTRFLQECGRVLRPEAPLVIGFVPAGSAWGQNLLRKKETGPSLLSIGPVLHRRPGARAPRRKWIPYPHQRLHPLSDSRATGRI